MSKTLLILNFLYYYYYYYNNLEICKKYLQYFFNYNNYSLRQWWANFSDCGPHSHCKVFQWTACKKCFYFMIHEVIHSRGKYCDHAVNQHSFSTNFHSCSQPLLLTSKSVAPISYIFKNIGKSSGHIQIFLKGASQRTKSKFN